MQLVSFGGSFVVKLKKNHTHLLLSEGLCMEKLLIIHDTNCNFSFSYHPEHGPEESAAAI